MGEGGETCSSKNRFGSCLSLINAHADAFDADVDNADIEGDELSSGDDDEASSDSDVDAGIFSIFNDCAIEEDDILAEGEKY